MRPWLLVLLACLACLAVTTARQTQDDKVRDIFSPETLKVDDDPDFNAEYPEEQNMTPYIRTTLNGDFEAGAPNYAHPAQGYEIQNFKKYEEAEKWLKERTGANLSNPYDHADISGFDGTIHAEAEITRDKGYEHEYGTTEAPVDKHAHLKHHPHEWTEKSWKGWAGSKAPTAAPTPPTPAPTSAPTSAPTAAPVV